MATQQRGSGWSIKLVFNLYKIFGYTFIYYLMYPVTFFYFIFAKNVKEALKIYYVKIGKEFNNRIYFEHLRIFAITMVDRFITKADPHSYLFMYEDKPRPLELFDKGMILVLSHFGGWAASANVSRTDAKINIVMQEVMKEEIKSIEDSLGYKSNLNIIDINTGPIAVSIAIANALMENEVVAVMGDRASNPNARVKKIFFGEEAYFNKNPFEIACKMNKTLLIYFVIYIEKQKYKVEYIQIEPKKSTDMTLCVKEMMDIYVAKYEQIIRQYPHQWLNFFDFWKKEE